MLAEELSETVRRLHEECKLERWNELVEDVSLPPDLAVAFMTGRPELVKVAKPRALTADECRNLYHVLGVLIETNAQLRRHAEQIAMMVENWLGHFKGMFKTARQIECFANFRDPEMEEDPS